MKWEPLSIFIRLCCALLALFFILGGAVMYRMFSETNHLMEFLPVLVGAFGMGGVFGAAAVYGRSPNLREISRVSERDL